PWAAQVVGVQTGGTPQTLATPAPPQVWGATQTPQVSVPPQPSGMVPQFLPAAAQVVGVQTGGGGVLTIVPCQRVWWSTPPTVQLIRRSTLLPAATVPPTAKLNADARTSGAAWAANGVSVAVPEMPPTVTVPAHPTGKRARSMLVRLTRTRVPSV